MPSVSSQRLLPYLLNLMALLLVAGLLAFGAHDAETTGFFSLLPAVVILPFLGVLLVVNVLTALVLLLLRHGGLAAGFAVAAVFIVVLVLLVGLFQVYAFLTAGKIGG